MQRDKGADSDSIDRQMDVMRGQIFNLREALRTHKSPVGLVQMPPQLMVEVSFYCSVVYEFAYAR